MKLYEAICKMRDNGYSCFNIKELSCTDTCPFSGMDCGACGNETRKKLVDDWFKQYADIEKLEQKYKELGEKIEAMKNPKIIFDLGKNYGTVKLGTRCVLGVDCVRKNAVWHTFSGCAQCCGTYASGHEAIDAAIKDGYKVIELDSTPEAVANFLLGKDGTK